MLKNIFNFIVLAIVLMIMPVVFFIDVIIINLRHFF
ncbi:hypothetical protein pzkkv8_113 [Klebsiella phage pzk-kv8]|nr:hypothetical protein pzkkv8_113 [Klebsiella phage pzk-kv8]